MTEPLDVRVTVDAVPEPGLLRPAIEAALAGRAWPPGPERQVAAVVAAAVRGAYAGRPGGAGGTSPGPQAPGIRTPQGAIRGGEPR